jgi:hypothetical protein
MSEAKQYTGSCHCGAVQYEVTTDLTQTIVCNCSICSRAGWVLTFVPVESFTLLQGEDNLTNYQFNKNVIDHLFCKTCGIHAFGRGKSADGAQTAAINVRCLEGVDIKTLNPMEFDGKSR